MLPSLIGIIASSGGAAAVGDYESIATVTVGSGGSSSVTFSSIPSTYKHLQIRGLQRTSNTSGTNWTVNVRFNADTGSNYAYHGLRGDGSSAIAYAGANQTIALGIISGDDANTALAWGVGYTDVLDYADTNKFKTIRTLTGFEENGSGMVELTSGLWRNTAAIDSITLGAGSGNFLQYSSFALYGVK